MPKHVGTYYLLLLIIATLGKGISQRPAFLLVRVCESDESEEEEQL